MAKQLMSKVREFLQPIKDGEKGNNVKNAAANLIELSSITSPSPLQSKMNVTNTSSSSTVENSGSDDAVSTVDTSGVPTRASGPSATSRSRAANSNVLQETHAAFAIPSSNNPLLCQSTQTVKNPTIASLFPTSSSSSLEISNITAVNETADISPQSSSSFVISNTGIIAALSFEVSNSGIVSETAKVSAKSSSFEVSNSGIESVPVKLPSCVSSNTGIAPEIDVFRQSQTSLNRGESAIRDFHKMTLNKISNETSQSNSDNLYTTTQTPTVTNLGLNGQLSSMGEQNVSISAQCLSFESGHSSTSTQSSLVEVSGSSEPMEISGTSAVSSSFEVSLSGIGTDECSEVFDCSTLDNNIVRMDRDTRIPGNNNMNIEPWVVVTTGNRDGDSLLDLDKDTLTKEKIHQKIDKQVRQNKGSHHVREIQLAVEGHIDYLLKTLNQQNPTWKFKLIKCGSYYESLRVGLPYEFDYMVELQHFKTTEVLPGTSQKLDHMIVKFVLNDTDKTKPVEVPPLSALYAKAETEYIRFKRNLVPQVREILRKHKTHNGLKLLEISDHNNSPNLCIYFKYKEYGVMVDLVTCVKFPNNCRNILPAFDPDTVDFIRDIIPQIRNNAPKEEVENFIVNRLYLVSTNVENKWRISTSSMDLLIMINLPNNIKSSLRVVKHLCNLHLLYKEGFDLKYVDLNDVMKYFGYKQFIPTFVFKLLFLHELIDLHKKHGNVAFLQHDETEENLITALIQYLKDFKAYKTIGKTVEINSILFAKSHLYKFQFGQDMAMLRDRHSSWYEHMVKIVMDIVHNNGNARLAGNFYQLMNYPLVEGVACYPRNDSYDYFNA